MKNTMYFIFVGILLVTACSLPIVKTSWSKPGAQPGEFERTQADCWEEAGQVMLAGLSEQARFDTCMEQEGWFLIQENQQ